MGLKEENEITLKIKENLNDFYKTLENKNFKIVKKFSMDDTYFLPQDLDIKNMPVRQILAKAILTRNLENQTNKTTTNMMVYKIKNIDEEGKILDQKNIICQVYNLEEANSLLKSIGYRPIMRIKENDIVYEKDSFSFAVKDIENGDKLIEIETNDKFKSIEELIEKVEEYELPVYKDNYFVKKAEIEMEKVLNKEYIGKIVNVEIDRPLNSKHPKHGFIYPVNYGFVPNTISGDGEELDCYVLGVDEPINTFEGRCIAIIHRTNDNDDKLIIVPDGKEFTDEEIRKLTNFQEQYFESVIIR